MSRLHRSARILKNAEAALISAIEIYNKPALAYREETFAILALNAWELLLKAKLLEIHKNKLRCLHIYSTRELSPGVQSRKQYVKRNRTGNKMTIGIDGCFARLEAERVVVPEAVKKNLAALAEVRDNAIPGDRGVIDLLGVTRRGQLVIIELKASEDIQLPMQSRELLGFVSGAINAKGAFTVRLFCGP